MLEIIKNNDYPFFSSNKTSSSKNLFEARKEFDNFITKTLLQLEKNVSADVLKKQSFYGHIDKEGDYIKIKDENDSLRKIGDNLFLQKFVADAFADLKNYLKKATIAGKFPSDSVYSNINVKAGYASLSQYYISNVLNFYTLFKYKVDNNQRLNSKIKSHKEFNTEFIKIIEKYILSSPITYSQTSAYLNLYALTSGLMFTISNDDPGEDSVKYENWFVLDELDCFHEACKRFGFTIDRSVPWLLLADINSPAMKKYINKYKIKDSNDLLKNKFDKCYKIDLTVLKDTFYAFYYKFITENPTYEEDTYDMCKSNTRTSPTVQRKPVSADKYFQDFNNAYWTRLYVYLKNLETRRGLNQQDFENVVREANDAIINGDEEHGLKFINGIFRGYGALINYNPLQDFQGMLSVEDPPVGYAGVPKIIF